MRVVHTSDWHIGRRFKGVDLLEYQRKALDWLVAFIEREHVDVLCVAGDVYDSPRPSTGAVRLFNEVFGTLGNMRVNGHPLEIIFTPGNHDSADRLGTGAALMRPNVHMRCEIEAIADPVIVKVGGERLAVYTVPYLDPDLSRPVLQGMIDAAAQTAETAEGNVGERAQGNVPADASTNGDGEDDAENDGENDEGNGETGNAKITRSHEGVMQAALRLITSDLAKRRAEEPTMAAMLMAHAFISGAQPSDSERNISVGGVDSVPAALFSNTGLDYLALGHLHRPQAVTIPQLAPAQSVFHGMRTPQARYSGALLAYSFSECRMPPVEGNGKSVVLLDVDATREPEPGGNAVRAVSLATVESGEPAFASIEGTLEEVLGPLASEYGEDWVSITVHLNEYPRGLYQRIDGKYANALEKHVEYDGRTASATRTMADMKTAVDEMEVLEGFVRYSLGREIHDDERAVLTRVVERVRARGAEHAGGGDVAQANGNKHGEETR
ncbi:exonuclease SbcCD subunit D [Bifidobacterium sp. 64T4]|uniref:exonuclease SbcCD subunit D n=1 Tax=Bifidobacterium pongonis TaxID=2834432 RepID=UPI001C57FBC1|nr:exonuclease SbcCD subunit D [Bifidobacterium pongonis]MBW3094226.1 exonuclease SbcCD subunit D [Bifidobacterium pongonis]